MTDTTDTQAPPVGAETFFDDAHEYDWLHDRAKFVHLLHERDAQVRAQVLEEVERMCSAMLSQAHADRLDHRLLDIVLDEIRALIAQEPDHD